MSIMMFMNFIYRIYNSNNKGRYRTAIICEADHYTWGAIVSVSTLIIPWAESLLNANAVQMHIGLAPLWSNLTNLYCDPSCKCNTLVSSVHVISDRNHRRDGVVVQ